jgi:phosphate starvation-inducible membrane PsiE
MLIEIVGAEHQTGTDIVIIASAILLLSFAVLVLRFGSHRFPSDSPAADLQPNRNKQTS